MVHKTLIPCLPIKLLSIEATIEIDKSVPCEPEIREIYLRETQYIFIEVEKPVEVVREVVREVKPEPWKLGKDISPLPVRNSEFDCDDATLFMYLWFTYSGYDTKIMYGNLKKTHEPWELCNHYWVIVNSDNVLYPYDSGYYMPDEQHFEGFVIPYSKLLFWAKVDQDKVGGTK